MFNLEQAIAGWRRQMAEGGVTSAEVLDELENHLRDDVEEQVRLGTEAERAFDSAVQRIGTATTLRKEFAKCGGRKGALRQIFLRGFYFISVTVVILSDIWTLVSFELNSIERAAGAFAVAMLTLYLFGLPFLPLRSWGVRYPRLAGMMKAAGIIVPVWAFWALLTAIHLIHVEIGIVPKLVMWSFCAAYGLTALAGAFNGGRGGHGGAGDWLWPSYPGPQPIPPGRPPQPEVDIPVSSSTRVTPIAQRVLALAREEALGLGHEYIGTEHLLLGVLGTARGVLAKALQRRQVRTEAVRAEILRLITTSPAHPPAAALPLTPRARKALRFAAVEAEALRHPSLGAEHILLGLLLEGRGIAALALKNLGIRIEQMRDEVAGAWGHQ